MHILFQTKSEVVHNIESLCVLFDVFFLPVQMVAQMKKPKISALLAPSAHQYFFYLLI